MPHEFDDEIRFRPTSGRIMGSLAVIAAFAVVVIAVVDPGVVPAPVVAGAALLGVLGWASMLWPRVSVTPEHLVLRTMVQHQRLPLAAVEDLAVRQVLAVRVGDRRYVSTAIGKSWRKAMVGDRTATRKDADKPITEVAYADYVEQEIRRRMEHARAVAGVGLLSDEQLALAAGVRRKPAWLPIALMAVATLGLLVSFVL
ncbi:hypothetical protein [Nocardioides sp.]|uniref:hypothetical protein n=1 Tax=Nocardioides sp. TaxID=35761 RepID=UPI00286E86C1|nr:hypothetical protein [Nocardioides sp.]